MKITGMKELQAKLATMAENARAIDGENNVKLGDLFAPAFMARYTNFASIDALFIKSGFKAETAEDIKAIPEAEFDLFIAANTKFESWNAMKSKAAGEWAAKKIGF